MAFQRGIDGCDPVRASETAERAGLHEERRAARPWRLATGTLACPRCDAPVSLGARTVRPPDDLDCPFCLHSGAVRDFLSLTSPSRPARVQVRLLPGARRAVR